jgi:hypothetical protein
MGVKGKAQRSDLAIGGRVPARRLLTVMPAVDLGDERAGSGDDVIDGVHADTFAGTI